MKGKFFMILGLLAVAALAAGPAEAGCAPNLNAFTTFSGFFGTTYITFPAGADVVTTSPNVVGRFWQTGAKATTSSDGGGSNCLDTAWLQQDSGGPNTFGIFGYMGGSNGIGGYCEPQGCATGNAHFVVETTSTVGDKAYIAVYRSTELSPDTTHNWDLSEDGVMTAAEIPRPQVTTSSRVLTNVIVDLTLVQINSAFHGALDGHSPSGSITAYRLMEASSNTDPGRNPVAWTVKSTHAYTGSNVAVTGVTVDCSAVTTDKWLATQLELDNNQTASTYVSAGVQIECDPNLADPGKFKIIPRGPSKKGVKPEIGKR